MLDPKHINELVQKVVDSLPPAIKSLPKEAEQNLKGALHAGFSKLDLVTREEFDAQAAVLQKTRSKLEKLEKRLKELEQQKK